MEPRNAVWGRGLGVVGRGAVAVPVLPLGVIAWAVAAVVAGVVVLVRPVRHFLEARRRAE